MFLTNFPFRAEYPSWRQQLYRFCDNRLLLLRLNFFENIGDCFFNHVFLDKLKAWVALHVSHDLASSLIIISALWHAKLDTQMIE